MMEKNGIFIFGLDGASFSLLDPWFAKGELPNLYLFKQKGSYGHLKSVPNLHSAAAWTSMVTGKNPGKHGIFFFYERDKDFNFRFISGADRKAETIWNILSKAGRKVGIVNVPMTFPAEPVNGIMVSGLDSPSIKDKRSFYPPSLRERYPILGSAYDIVPSVEILMQKNRLEKAVDKWLEICSHRAEFCKSLLRDQDFAFFMVTFTATDWAHHNLWKYIDPTHPFFEENEAKRFGPLMLEIYRKIDFILGEFLKIIGPQVNIFILSDHGTGKHQHGSYFLLDWLIEHDFLCLKEKKKKGNAQKMMLTEFLKFSKNALPDKFKIYLKMKYPQLRKTFREETGQSIFHLIDWSKTKAYTEFKWHSVWINLKGREKHGIVNSEKEYRALLQALKEGLLDWKDEVTGKNFVNKVFFRDEIYRGPYVYRAPDLQILWEDDVVVSPIRGREIFPEMARKIKQDWSGDHRPEGIFMAKGPDVKKGVALSNLSIYDVAPTILYLLNALAPNDVDGQVLREMISD